MKVYQAAANAFVKEGTSVIFGLMGDGQLPWWSAMSEYPEVQIIDVREEGAALAMAEGWATATGKIGVCSVTQGPGLARTTTSLICATRSRTPIVVYTSRTAFNNENNIQFLEQERLVTATGAGYIEVLTPSFAENAVRQAFYRARLESRPVVLCVPSDVQTKECDSDGDDYKASVVNFAGQQRIRADLDRLQEAVQIIAASKKPVVVLGRGAVASQALKAAEELAERIGALTATSLLANGALGDSGYHAGISGLYSTRSVMQLFDEADCVIAMGAGLNPRTIEGGYLYPNARIVHIDVAPHIMMGNDKGADCYLQGDAAATTQEIVAMLKQQGYSQEGYRTAAVRKILRDADRDPSEFEIEPGTVDPRAAVSLIDDRLPSNVGLVCGTGHAATGYPIWNMKKSRPLKVYVYAFGCIGQGLANAIGVGVAVRDPIVCFEGDGGAMQNIQELDTAAQLGLKLLYVVLNDEAYGAEYHRLVSHKLNTKLSLHRSPDFGAMGRVFGCRGRIARTLEDVADGIAEFMAGEGPMVLDVRISRNVTSISYRRLHYGQDV